ncbi:MAG: hypothetical protein K1X78_26125 [Verrucomicrobiaceae bacterium]|nr:hypothetical protein [Verrucomicrobiaceae bacterium]
MNCSLLLRFFLFACLTSSAATAQSDPQTQQALDGIPIRPSMTDAAIQEFDNPHWIYINRDSVVRHDAKATADRHELLLWIPGTQPSDVKPQPGRVSRGGANEFCKLAATLGYHVISLSYPNTISASICRNENDPGAFEAFRMAIIQGGETAHIKVSRTDSIENRLIKLLRLLSERRAREEWAQFLTKDGGIQWDRIAVAGQSQGGGHAALLAIHHKVARALCFGAPKDYSQALQAPAAWYLKEPATAKERFFTFNHDQDRQGCTPAQQIENLKALKLDALGSPVHVEDSKPPFNKSRILMTNYPGTKVDSLTAHGTMISARNKDLFGEVWRYMLLQE